jgi:hypothetical protein
LQINVSGNSISGSYQTGGITGTVSGNTIRGTWTDTGGSGDFQFTLSPDSTAFSGQWRTGSSGNWLAWNGSCLNAGGVATTSRGGGASGPPSGSTGSGGTSSGEGAGCQRSRLVLLQGLATDSTSSQPYFADIVNAVGGNYSGVTYFSYNANDPQNYSEQDSLQSDAKSVEVLHAAIMREIANCSGVTLDLIGHSNGGVVALEYLAKYGTTPEASHIRHLVTLDSPLNGLSSSFLNSLVQEAALFGVDLSYLQNAPAIRDLIALYNDSGTPQRNINLAKSLAGKIGILTMGSDNDLVVPYQSASIPGFSSEWSLPTTSSYCPTYIDACVGHNEILHDSGVIAKIASFLKGN